MASNVGQRAKAAEELAEAVGKAMESGEGVPGGIGRAYLKWRDLSRGRYRERREGSLSGLSSERRTEIAKMGSAKRWGKV